MERRQGSAGNGSMIGDAEYLKTLSGYKQKSAVRIWCRKNGIRYLLDARGWPVTTPEALDRALKGSAESGINWDPYQKKVAAKGYRKRREREQDTTTAGKADGKGAIEPNKSS
jgi:hypothetical protein